MDNSILINLCNNSLPISISLSLVIVALGQIFPFSYEGTAYGTYSNRIVRNNDCWESYVPLNGCLAGVVP